MISQVLYYQPYPDYPSSTASALFCSLSSNPFHIHVLLPRTYDGRSARQQHLSLSLPDGPSLWYLFTSISLSISMNIWPLVTFASCRRRFGGTELGYNVLITYRLSMVHLPLTRFTVFFFVTLLQTRPNRLATATGVRSRRTFFPLLSASIQCFPVCFVCQRPKR